MSLVVNQNLMAKNVANSLNRHYAELAISTQRLSNGLRINSAADDAAGLAIRELMRAEVSTLKQGIRNVNDAISMIQIADSALAIIDEKLIRMKELAEQAATGTYDSVQRLMIDSEFTQMAFEINRIANATDFNGIHLLNGNLSGTHNGKGLNSTGKLKVHFGTGNDSAEDYYYVEIGDARTESLGLGSLKSFNDGNEQFSFGLNDIKTEPPKLIMNIDTKDDIPTISDVFKRQGEWKNLTKTNTNKDLCNFVFKIPKGTKNIIINGNGHTYEYSRIRWYNEAPNDGDNDLNVFTLQKDDSNNIIGLKHISGRPEDDWVFSDAQFATSYERIASFFGITRDKIDDSELHTGFDDYDGISIRLKTETIDGMNIGYTGDSEYHDSYPNNGTANTYLEYEILSIDEAKEDLYIWNAGGVSGFVKAYWDLDESTFNDLLNGKKNNDLLTISTQQLAQQALRKIDRAIISKDQIRAHLGALQNRLENTVTNLTIQAENLQVSESQISDLDFASEMTNFVRNQILAQSAVAMLSQANTLPQMAMRLIGAA